MKRAKYLRSAGILQLIVLIALLGLPQVARSGADSAPEAVRISAEDGPSRTLRGAEIASTPHRTAVVTDDKGLTTSYHGVPVEVLLQAVGAPLGAKLRGPQMRLYVLVEGGDGYAAVFALAEFDPGFNNRTILLADSRGGKPLSSFEGPFRLIVPGEKRRARWVRNVIAIEVRKAR